MMHCSLYLPFLWPILGVSCYYDDAYNRDESLFIYDDAITGFNDIWFTDSEWDYINIITLKNNIKVVQKCMEKEDFCLCRMQQHRSKHECYSTASHQSLSNFIEDIEMYEMMGGKKQKTGHKDIVLPDGSHGHSFVTNVYPDPPIQPIAKQPIAKQPAPRPHAQYYIIVAHGGFYRNAYDRAIPSTQQGNRGYIMRQMNIVFYWPHGQCSTTNRQSATRDDRVYARLTGTGAMEQGQFVGMPHVNERILANTISQAYAVTPVGAERQDLGGWRVLYVEQQNVDTAPHVVATIMRIEQPTFLVDVLTQIFIDAMNVRHPRVPLPIDVHWIACRIPLN